MADGILTPCNVARSWHWFRQVTAPCNVAWNRDSEFTKWQHPAMWYVALGWHAIEFARWQHPAVWHSSGIEIEFARWQHPAVWQVPLGWHAIEFTQTSAILEFYLVAISSTSPQSTCHSAPVSKMLSKSDHLRQKKMTSCRFSRWRISAILDFRDPIMGSLKGL